LGHKCVIVAPGLTPFRPTDRVKTDYRDAKKIARLYRAGELTEIHIPDTAEEAARDLTRAREDALGDRSRARNRLSMFLLRHGRVFRVRRKSWGRDHRVWLMAQFFDNPVQQQSFTAYVRAVDEVEARIKTLDDQIEDLAQSDPYRTPVRYLRCLKGVETLTAFTLVAEAQDIRRFPNAKAFMSYTGLVSSEYSSGDKIRRGSITKAGNAHIRRVLGEAAWAYQFHREISPRLTRRREGCPPEIIRIAQQAERRLGRKFTRMVARGKPHQVAVIAVARELAGFVWAISRYFPAAA
jgi:transposase